MPSLNTLPQDRGAGGKVNEHDFSPILSNSTENSEARLHLLYRPGHYDILYKK